MTGGESPGQPGQLSPDGMWWWDGQRWVPTVPAAPPRSSRAWIPWLVGGCVLVALVVAILIGFGVVAALKNFQANGFSCLPSDFPKYTGATISGEYTYFGTNVAPGDSRSCQMTLQSSDDVATATNFYVGQLGAGDWSITANDQTSGEIRFQRKSRPATVGTIDMVGRGQHSEIRIRLDS